MKTITPDGSYILRTFFPETKQITAEIPYADKGLKVAHGKASFWHENGNLKSTGSYSNGNKESSWKYYHRNAKNILSEGSYIKNQQNGPWKIYDNQGRLKEELIFVNDVKEGNFIQYDSLSNVINEGSYRSDTIFTQSKIVVPLDSTDVQDEQMPYLSQCKHLTDKKARNTCRVPLFTTFLADQKIEYFLKRI